MVTKFRAWDKGEKKMYLVASIDFVLEKVELWKGTIRSKYGIASSIRDSTDVELMQSIGLLNCETEDGKNVEGWEGDIADIGWSDQIGEFHSHRIVLKKPFNYSIDEAGWMNHAEYIIIRGNIYENPELLEKTNES